MSVFSPLGPSSRRTCMRSRLQEEHRAQACELWPACTCKNCGWPPAGVHDFPYDKALDNWPPPGWSMILLIPTNFPQPFIVVRFMNEIVVFIIPSDLAFRFAIPKNDLWRKSDIKILSFATCGILTRYFRCNCMVRSANQTRECLKFSKHNFENHLTVLGTHIK